MVLGGLFGRQPDARHHRRFSFSDMAGRAMRRPAGILRKLRARHGAAQSGSYRRQAGGNHVEIDETWVGGRTRGEGYGVSTIKLSRRLCRRGSSSETGNRAGQAKGRTLCRACQARRSTRSERRLALWVRRESAVAPRTLTVTDDWSGYASLGKRGYEHLCRCRVRRPRGCRGLSADHAISSSPI